MLFHAGEQSPGAAAFAVGVARQRLAPAFGESGDCAQQAAELIRERPRIFLGIAPEGTRRRVGKWKTGFYRIALLAGVPIVTVALDYPNRRAIIWPPFEPTGDLDADLALIQARYDRSMAFHPDRFS